MHRDISQALANWIALEDRGEFILRALMVCMSQRVMKCFAKQGQSQRHDVRRSWIGDTSLRKGLMLLIFRQLFRCRVTTCETATASCGLRSLPPSHHKPQLWPLATSLVGVPELFATAVPCITPTDTDRLTKGFKSPDFPTISDSPDNPTCCCSTTSNILFCLVILQRSLGGLWLSGH